MINKVAPIIVGDILISDREKPTEFIMPSLIDNVLQYLSADANAHPIKLLQKIYILKSNVCIAFAGKLFYIGKFLEDITVFCRSHISINKNKIVDFLNDYSKDDSWEHFSFIILVAEHEGESFYVGKILHGNWQIAESDIFGEVVSAGSGSVDFIKEIKREAAVKTSYERQDIKRTLQLNIMLICRLLVGERLTLDTLKMQWGAGFEMIYYDGKQFAKLDNITYVINKEVFNEDGDIPEVPIPAVILHYKYSGEILTITVIKSLQGSTILTDNSYVVKCEKYESMKFKVVPIGYLYLEDDDLLSGDSSFVSTSIAMGYIIDTQRGYYLPASFNSGPELEINYDEKVGLKLIMKKEINDKLVDEARKMFPNL